MMGLRGFCAEAYGKSCPAIELLVAMLKSSEGSGVLKDALDSFLEGALQTGIIDAEKLVKET